MPERLAQLTETVRNTMGYEIWQPDLTPNSLWLLGAWFAGEVETRMSTDEELREIGALKNLPGMRWDQLLWAPRLADYGQRVIVGFGKVPLNPCGLRSCWLTASRRGRS